MTLQTTNAVPVPKADDRDLIKEVTDAAVARVANSQPLEDIRAGRTHSTTTTPSGKAIFLATDTDSVLNTSTNTTQHNPSRAGQIVAAIDAFKAKEIDRIGYEKQGSLLLPKGTLETPTPDKAEAIPVADRSTGDVAPQNSVFSKVMRSIGSVIPPRIAASVAAVATVFGFGSQAAMAEIITLSDTLTFTNNYEHTGFGAGHNLGTLSGDSTLDRVAGMTFMGDGNILNDISISFQYLDNSGVNKGDFSLMDWRVGIYNDKNDFTIQGLQGQSGFKAPDLVLDLDTPDNADYLSPFHTNSIGVNNHLAVASLRHLEHRTSYGIEGIAFFTPYSNAIGGSGSTQTGATLSDNSAWTINPADDITDFGGDGFLPGRLKESPYNYSHDDVAGKLTSFNAAVPEPGQVAFFIVSAALIAGRLVYRARVAKQKPTAEEAS